IGKLEKKGEQRGCAQECRERTRKSRPPLKNEGALDEPYGVRLILHQQLVDTRKDRHAQRADEALSGALQSFGAIEKACLRGPCRNSDQNDIELRIERRCASRHENMPAVSQLAKRPGEGEGDGQQGS